MKIGDVVGKEVKIKIISVFENAITAKVIFVDEFWGSFMRTKPFYVGMELVFINPNKQYNSWIIKLPNELPWFILDIDKNTFEHYR